MCGPDNVSIVGQEKSISDQIRIDGSIAEIATANTPEKRSPRPHQPARAGTAIEANRTREFASDRLSINEEQDVEHIFHLCDVDDSGEISKQEFFRFFLDLPRVSPWVAEVLGVKRIKPDVLFAEIDSDHDKTITLEELRTYITNQLSLHHGSLTDSILQGSRKHIDEVDDEANEPEDETLDGGMKKRLSLVQAQDIQAIFETCDLDGSGDISKQEFYRFCLALPRVSPWISEVLGVKRIKPDVLFSQIDCNNDKSITQKELREYISKQLRCQQSGS
jgi:Ca2+-binding EF-hand superfamily protein